MKKALIWITFPIKWFFSPKSTTGFLGRVIIVVYLFAIKSYESEAFFIGTVLGFLIAYFYYEEDIRAGSLLRKHKREVHETLHGKMIISDRQITSKDQ